MPFIMRALDYYYQVLDFPRRVKFLILRKFGKFSAFSNSERSDSESTPYSEYVRNVLQAESKYLTFRKNYSYRLILEHVDYKLGRKYLESLDDTLIAEYFKNENLKALSILGSPRKYYYSRIGWISPTIIRYLYVHQHIINLFGKSNFEKVGEIGIGFGGQCAISTELGSIKTYSAYDLPEVLSLSEKTLRSCKINFEGFQKMDIETVAPATYDLVISNYAFSELPKAVQLDYLHNVLSQSKRGYLTMNSGRGNFTGRSEGKLTLEEIIQIIPGCSVLEELPLTGPDNYILIWGNKLV